MEEGIVRATRRRGMGSFGGGVSEQGTEGIFVVVVVE